MRLRRSVLDKPGITRKRCGGGFIYYAPGGVRVDDANTLARIKALVIPPAWKKVWISPWPNGHIQAVGTDVAGRRQYLYHQCWQQERAEEKFDRVLDLSTKLPEMRAQITKDLRRRGLPRDRVLSLALRLLDRGYFRAGGEQYAEDNDSYGLATLRRDHVRARGNIVSFDYPAKSGVQRTLEVDDSEVARAVRSLVRRSEGSERLLVCRRQSGWSDVHADDLNRRFKELVGDDYSVKDLRTWHGTVLAAHAFALADPATTGRIARKVTATVMKEVAESLGNTPAVARSAYVDPRVVRAYENGATIVAAARRASGVRRPEAVQDILEKATRALIRRTIRQKHSTGEMAAAA